MVKFCPKCGEELIDSAKFCKSCGASIDTVVETPANSYEIPVVEKSHTLAIVIGYIGALLIPIVGVIAGVYLYTRKDSSKANKHAKFILIIAVAVWILSIISIFR